MASVDLDDLGKSAKRCRRRIVDMVYKAQSGHPGGSLSCIDILVTLYRGVMRFDPGNPDWDDRDRFIMSKGHASPAVYSILRDLDVLSDSDLDGFRSMGSVCQGHVDRKWTKGVDFSAGSLGMGLSFGLGSALAARLDRSDRHTWVLLGDGEIQEGQVWEAAMATTHLEVSNITAIVDKNRIQNDNFVEEQMRVGDISAKFASFGWNVIEVDGHDLAEVLGALEQSRGHDGATAIVAATVKGKGVSFMEDNPAFHGAAPNSDQYATAMEELA
jgi:transketolase